MALQLLCRKLGMTQLFDESGDCIPVTVLEAEPNVVVQKKTEARDGYTALQLGYQKRRAKGVTRALAGHFAAAKTEPRRHLLECRVTPEEASAHDVGSELKVDLFEKGQRIDVIGTSKGRGTAGVVKRHGFAIKRKTHGTHEFFRHGGSIGAGASPGRVIKGMKMPGRMGNCRVTTLDVEVVDVDAERGLLFVKGSVPGHVQGVVRVRSSVKS